MTTGWKVVVLNNMNQVVYYTVLLSVFVSAVNYSRIDEGYPVGLTSDCPGSEKPAQIKPEILKKLFISVMGPGPVLGAKLTPYDYYHIRNLSKHPGIDFNRRTYLYVGGYLDSTTWGLGKTLGELYRNMGYNVLIMDSLEFTATYYPIAARNMRPLGWHAAEMIANLTELGLDPKKLDVSGISLGGQLMSFMAKSFRKITGKNISSLTAFDPSGVCFRNRGPEDRLDSSDADFVLNLVSNMDGFGMGLPVGHVTFYINGGEYQPGDVWWLPCPVICSHVKSYFYWLAALLHPHEFIGIECDSVQQARDGACFDRRPRVTNTLDIYTDRTKPGIYYLQTSGKFPYALGKKGLKKWSAKEVIRNASFRDVFNVFKGK